MGGGGGVLVDSLPERVRCSDRRSSSGSCTASGSCWAICCRCRCCWRRRRCCHHFRRRTERRRVRARHSYSTLVFFFGVFFFLLRSDFRRRSPSASPPPPFPATFQSGRENERKKIGAPQRFFSTFFSFLSLSLSLSFHKASVRLFSRDGPLRKTPFTGFVVFFCDAQPLILLSRPVASSARSTSFIDFFSPFPAPLLIHQLGLGKFGNNSMPLGCFWRSCSELNQKKNKTKCSNYARNQRPDPQGRSPRTGHARRHCRPHFAESPIRFLVKRVFAGFPLRTCQSVRHKET